MNAHAGIIMQQTVANPPSGPNPKQDRSRISTRLLVQAAAELIAERGYERTTLAAIGKRAGYSPGLVTLHFGSKEGLLWAVIETMMVGYWRRSEMRAAVGRAVGLDYVHRLCEALRASARRDPASQRAMFSLTFEGVKPGSVFHDRIQALLRDQRRTVEVRLEQGVEAGNIHPEIDPKEVAAVIMSGLRGAAFHWLLDPTFDYDAAVAAFDRYLHVILTHPHPATFSAASEDRNGHHD
jgi:AcrR family transcriptional regulator